MLPLPFYRNFLGGIFCDRQCCRQ